MLEQIAAGPVVVVVVAVAGLDVGLVGATEDAAVPVALPPDQPVLDRAFVVVVATGHSIQGESGLRGLLKRPEVGEGVLAGRMRRVLAIQLVALDVEVALHRVVRLGGA